MKDSIRVEELTLWISLIRRCHCLCLVSESRAVIQSFTVVIVITLSHTISRQVYWKYFCDARVFPSLHKWRQLWQGKCNQTISLNAAGICVCVLCMYWAKSVDSSLNFLIAMLIVYLCFYSLERTRVLSHVGLMEYSWHSLTHASSP